MAILISLGINAPQAGSILIQGAARVGETLSLSSVPLTGESPITLSVEWQRDGASIPGERGAAYVVQPGDLGTAIGAAVTYPDNSVATSANTLLIQAAGTGTGGGGTGTASVSLTEFTRDRVVYDSGAAVGRNWATVPVSGTTDAPDGATIEARVIREDTGGEVLGWQSLGQALGGAFAGDLTGVPATASWLRPEVRVQGATATATTVNRFASGHVIDIWGQSEFHRSVMDAFANVGIAPAVIDDEALQISYVDGVFTSAAARVIARQVTNADKVTGHVVGLANVFATERPGEKFHVVYHTRSGTSVAEALTDDPSAERTWAGEVALRDAALADGEHAGLAWMSWYAEDAPSIPNSFGEYWFTALTGLEPDGSPAVRGALDGLAYGRDHFFSDMYDYSRTGFVIAGPHRFESTAQSVNMATVRDGLETMFENPNLPATITRGLQTVAYLNGDATGGDRAHPNAGSIDGYHELLRQTGLSMLNAMGLTSWTDVPAFDRAEMAPDGTYVEVWSTAGPITTTREARAEALPGGRLAQIWKFRWSGVDAERVDLVGGRARVYFNAGGDPIPQGEVLSFADRGVTSDNSADFLAGGQNLQVWKDYPMVLLDGQLVPVQPKTPASVLNVVPGVTVAPDPNTNPDLLAPAVSGFEASASAPGWTQVPNGWVLDPAADLAANDGTINTTLQSAENFVAHRGRDLEMSFVATSPNGATGPLLVIVRATGGGGNDLFNADVAIDLTGRTTIPLGVFPANRSNLSIRFLRRPGGSGDVNVTQLTVKEVP